ncbi:MAG: hypothetical protein IAE80_07815 [Anaerolinea sp.]|nr:hypothetical protein [Anaerolinea sp.]
MPPKAATSDSLVDENFISSDAGNGWAACYRLVNGKVKQHGIPHARARVTGAKLDTDIGAQNTADYADFMGQRYGYGDGIWNLTDAPIDLHQNTARRYGGNMHIFLMLVNIAEMNVKSGSELTLIVPAPPGLLNEVGPQIKKSILAGESGKNDGVWSIQLRKDKKPREYKFIRVITLPEGAGAVAAYRFNLAGDLVDLKDKSGGDMLAGRIAVLDLGAGTGDTYTIFNGNLNPDAIATATDDKAGVIHNLLRPILSDVLSAVPEARHLTTAHIDSYLRRYIANPTPEAATVRVAGKNVNFEKSILANCERYAEWIGANKIDPLWAAGTDAIVQAGGGWIYIQSWIRKWYPERLILSPEMFPHTRNMPLYDLNGIGQLSFAAAIMRQQQP